MNHRLEMKAESTSSDLKDRGQAMNGHLPAHQTPRDCINRHPWENWFTRCIVQYIKGTTVGSVCCNHLKGYLGATSKSKCYGLWRALGLLQHGNNRPHTGYHCVVTAWQHYATYRIPLCCYSMAALCHILDTIVLLQHGSTMSHTGYHCVVTAWQHYATYWIPLCCYSMAALCHILDTIVLLQHGMSLSHSRMLLVEDLMMKSRMCSSSG